VPPVFSGAEASNFEQTARPEIGEGFFSMLAHDHPEVRGAEFVMFANEQRRYTDFTDAVCQLLGYSRKELLNKSVEEISYKMENVPQVFEQFVKQGAMEGDFILQHQDGTAIPIHYRAITCADGCHASVLTPIKDWREPYLSALIETNATRLTQKLKIAIAAIDKATRTASAAEQQALRDARSALGVLSRGQAH
jgi:PAS domain S-box-containing protein